MGYKNGSISTFENIIIISSAAIRAQTFRSHFYTYITNYLIFIQGILLIDFNIHEVNELLAPFYRMQTSVHFHSIQSS